MSIYVIAGGLLWVVVTIAIYAAARFTNTYLTPGRPGVPIGLLAAGAWALLFAVSILLTGWLQSERRRR